MPPFSQSVAPCYAMKAGQVDSLEGYLAIATNLGRTGRIFRGVRSANYELVPKIGRADFAAAYSPKAEEHLLELFKQRATAFIDQQPASQLEWLALGQHPGLPTRLLDWTLNPLVALYFATEARGGDLEGSSSTPKEGRVEVACRYGSFGEGW